MKNHEGKKFVILELNEFEFSLDWKTNYPRFSKAFPDNLYLSETKPDEKIEFNGLDPWVQWPTIHNQVPTKVHGQVRHGSVGNACAAEDSIFRKLDSSSLNYIAWGIMNPSHTSDKNIFLADPWSKNIISKPRELEKFISPIRYLAENYHNLNHLSLLPKLLNSLCYIFLKLKLKGLLQVIYESLLVVFKAKKINSSVMFILFENISINLFKKFDHNKDINFIFINSAAHFQHNHRKDQNTRKALDYFLAGIMRTIKERNENKELEIAIVTALTQKEANNIFVYNFSDGSNFLANVLRINFINLDIGMTSELNFQVNDKEDVAKIDRLKNIKISGKEVFYVDIKKTKSYYKVFIQSNIDIDVKRNEILQINDKTWPFYEIFYSYRERSGVHIPLGYIMSEKKTSKLPNQHIMGFLLREYLT